MNHKPILPSRRALLRTLALGANDGLTPAVGEITHLSGRLLPTAYVGRTPHIHVKVKRGGKELLTTECYIKGEPKNATDGVFNTIKDPKARERVQVAFVPLKGSTAGELTAHFDLVLEV